MWRTSLLAGLAVSVVAVTLGAAHAPATDAETQAKLELLGTRPVTVHGTGFRSHERVRLVLRQPSGVSRRKVRGDGAGTFSATFHTTRVGRCGTFSITAHGRAGSRATLVRRVPAACIPP
jgi:hypothetical protein